MPTNTTRSSYDTFIAEQYPDQNFGTWRELRLSAGTGTHRYGFVYFGGIPPAGSTVISATLSVWLRGVNWTGGPHTITAKRTTAIFRESKLTWNRSGAGQMATATNAGSASVTGGVDGQKVSIDVTGILADIAAGQPWYGIRLEADAGTAAIRDLYSSEASDPDLRPELVVEWSRAPQPPVDLAPSGGRSVSLAKPTLAWVYKDPDGDQQASAQVQISAGSATNADGSLATPEFDSGVVATGDTQLDLAATAYAGLADGATRYWVVRVTDVNGLVSGWSDVASFRRDIKGTLAINSPINGGTVEETTPAITTTLTGRDQGVIAYRLWEDDGTGTFVSVWASGWFDAPAPAGTAFSFTIPPAKITKTGRNYKIDVWSYDTLDRQATPGDPTYVPLSAVFTFARSAVPAPVTTLAVVDEKPGVTLTWNRAAGQSAPDYWALVVDGVRIFDRLDPPTFSLGGDPIVYSATFYGAKPNLSHTIEIEAVVDDAGVLKHSAANATQTHTVDMTQVGGVWLVDDDEAPYRPATLPRRVRIRGAEVPDLQIGRSSSTFYVVGRPDPVEIVDAVRGWEGNISGIVEADDPAGAGFIENWEWMTQTPENVGRRFRLIFGDVNIPVQLIGQASNTHIDSHLRRHQVSTDVAQVGEFPGQP